MNLRTPIKIKYKHIYFTHAVDNKLTGYIDLKDNSINWTFRDGYKGFESKPLIYESKDIFDCIETSKLWIIDKPYKDLWLNSKIYKSKGKDNG